VLLKNNQNNKTPGNINIPSTLFFEKLVLGFKQFYGLEDEKQIFEKTPYRYDFLIDG